MTLTLKIHIIYIKRRKVIWHLQLLCGCTKFTVNAKAIASGQAVPTGWIFMFKYTTTWLFMSASLTILHLIFSASSDKNVFMLQWSPPHPSLPVRNLSDNDVSHLSCTEGVSAVGAWTHRNYTLYSQCVQNQIQFSPPHSSPMFERTQSYSEIQPAWHCWYSSPLVAWWLCHCCSEAPPLQCRRRWWKGSRGVGLITLRQSNCAFL